MPLRYLFLDMNSYFASVEQQMRPELRNQPVAVVPVLAETTCCIAASYEAKRCGVRTGTQVRVARTLCPGLRIVEANPTLYVAMHHRFVKAVESCIPVHAVRSIDEVVCRLGADERQPAAAARLANQIKAVFRRDLGEQLRCSIGLGPNQFLAKVASDIQKPDGLTFLHSQDLPHSLFSLQLRDFPGIGPRMEGRLERAGITAVRQLCELSAPELAEIWGGRWLGEIWWHQLRGDEVPETPTRRHTLGHSRVLPPALRNDVAAHAVLLRLLEKAAVRLRRIDYCTGSIHLAVRFLPTSRWEKQASLRPCQDTLTLLRAVNLLWKHKPPGVPLRVGVVLGNLTNRCETTSSLFAEDHKLLALSRAMDQIQGLCGVNSVYFAETHTAREQASTRIAFTHIPEIDATEMDRALDDWPH